MKLIVCLLILGIFTTAASCKKEIQPDTKWKVLELRLPNATSVLMPTKEYVIEFRADNSIGIKLDINSCFSQYKVSEATITINPLACTKACCDSEFAQNLTNTLSKMKTFRFKNDHLLLEGDGNIKLEQVK